MSIFAFRRVALGAALLAAAFVVHAETVSSLRVMLHPYAATWGELPAAQKERMEALTGTALTLTGSTRTGAIELSLGTAVDETQAREIVRKLDEAGEGDPRPISRLLAREVLEDDEENLDLFE